MRPLILNKYEAANLKRAQSITIRRPVEPQPEAVFTHAKLPGQGAFVAGRIHPDQATIVSTNVTYECPYAKQYDPVWIQEGWAPRDFGDEEPDVERRRRYLLYQADGGRPDDIMHWHYHGEKWQTADTMPQWAHRFECLVSYIHVTRLQNITVHQTIDEGIVPRRIGISDCYKNYLDKLRSFPAWDDETKQSAPIQSFATRWDRLYSPEYTWASNPLVWVITLYLEKDTTNDEEEPNDNVEYSSTD